jgi:hypothetical protein
VVTHYSLQVRDPLHSQYHGPAYPSFLLASPSHARGSHVRDRREPEDHEQLGVPVIRWSGGDPVLNMVELANGPIWIPTIEPGQGPVMIVVEIANGGAAALPVNLALGRGQISDSPPQEPIID